MTNNNNNQKWGFTKAYRDVYFYWAFVHEPTGKWTPTGTSTTEFEYSVKCVVTEEVMNKMKADGIYQGKRFELISTLPDKKKKEYPWHMWNRYVVKFTQNPKSKDGKFDLNIDVVDGDKNTIPKDVAIGNGSHGNLKIYFNGYPGGQNLGTRLNAIQVTGLVAYEAKAKDDGFEKVNTAADDFNNETAQTSDDDFNPSNQSQSAHSIDDDGIPF